MTSYRDLVQASSRWIDRVAATVLAGKESFRTMHRLRLVEQKDGLFVLQGYARKFASEALDAPFSIVDGHIDAEVSTKLADILRGAEVELVLKSDRFMF